MLTVKDKVLGGRAEPKDSSGPSLYPTEWGKEECRSWQKKGVRGNVSKLREKKDRKKRWARKWKRKSDLIYDFRGKKRSNT